MKAMNANQAAKRAQHIVEVQLTFPNIDKSFKYAYPKTDGHTLQDYVELAMDEFYQQFAGFLFALYGYAPMDVIVREDCEERMSYKSCYQEELWLNFFCMKGHPWGGKFSRFEPRLLSYRTNKDNHEVIAA